MPETDPNATIPAQITPTACTTSEHRNLPWAWLTILTMAGFMAAPVFGVAGQLHVDNAVHLAELHELARIGLRAWSELSFGGFPLGTLHSPLWYGLGAGLVRLGCDVGLLYGVLVWLSLAAPALALVHVGMRRGSLTAMWAVGLLWLSLPTHAYGYSSPVGGMWTFQLAIALLILLIDATGVIHDLVTQPS